MTPVLDGNTVRMIFSHILRALTIDLSIVKLTITEYYFATSRLMGLYMSYTHMWFTYTIVWLVHMKLFVSCSSHLSFGIMGERLPRVAVAFLFCLL